MALRCHTFGFDGRLLERGFWLYVWRIRCNGKNVAYVGRTGDSSSFNAASPFSRASQHLELRPGARANALVRNLRAAGMEPSACVYRFYGVGPIFAEAADGPEHISVRDKMAAVESAVANELRRRGHTVLGSHACRKPLDAALLQAVLAVLPEELLGPCDNDIGT
jgi:hypothetical protein